MEVVRRIGSGTYGRVYEVIVGGKKYALKRNLSPDEGLHVVSELDILNRLKGNPRIVSLEIAVIRDPDTNQECLSPVRINNNKLNLGDDVLHFFFEMADMTLEDWINSERVSFVQLKQLMVDILLGVESITLSDILHRDLKLNNIVIFSPDKDPLVSEEEDSDDKIDPLEGITKPMSAKNYNSLHRAKIIDLGLAKPIAADSRGTPGVTTSWYRAPEIIGGDKNYDSKVDAWAVGCIFYEMILKRPFTGRVQDKRESLIDAFITCPHYDYTEQDIKRILRPTRITRKMGNVCTIHKRISASQTFRNLIVNQISRSDSNVAASSTFDPRRRTAPFVSGTGTSDPGGSGGRRTFVTSRTAGASGPSAASGPSGRGPDQDIKKITDEIINQLSEVINSLLIIDPEKRSSVSQVLDSEFFDTHRDYIEKFRVAHPPSYICEWPYNIIDCIERSWAVEYARSIYHNSINYSWYSHRRLFHSIDLFDRVLRYRKKHSAPLIPSDSNGEILDQDDTEMHYFVCLFSSIKYFSSLHAPVKIDDLVPEHIVTDENIEKMAKLEVEMLTDIFNYNFYRHSVYEAINFAKPDASFKDRENWYDKALDYLTLTDLESGANPTDVNGMRPSDLANKIIEEKRGIQEVPYRRRR